MASCSAGMNQQDCQQRATDIPRDGTHGVGSGTEMLVDLSCVLWSSEEDGVASFWCSESEFIECQAFSTSSLDSLLCSLCESESSDRQFLLEVDQSCIVGDCSYDNDGLLGWVGFAVCHLARDAGYGYRWSVGSALKESLEDDLVEAAVGSSSEEAVELHGIVYISIICFQFYQSCCIEFTLTRRRR